MKRIFALLLVAASALALGQNMAPSPHVGDTLTYWDVGAGHPPQLVTAFVRRSVTVKAPQVQQPPITLSLAGYYDVKNRHNNAVLITKLRDLTIKGKPTGFEADAFVGSTVDKDGKAVLGIDFAYSKNLADQISAFIGIGISFSSGQVAGGGVIGGIKWDFTTK